MLAMDLPEAHAPKVASLISPEPMNGVILIHGYRRPFLANSAFTGSDVPNLMSLLDNLTSI